MRALPVRQRSSPGPLVALLLLTALLLATVSTGCAGNDTSEPTPSAPGTAAPPRVVLERVGGVAGRDDAITVEPDGRWSALDRTGAQRTGELPAELLDRWRQLTTDPRLTREADSSPAPSRCDDAFSYRLVVGTHVIRYVDCPVDRDRPAAAIALVSLLTGVTG